MSAVIPGLVVLLAVIVCAVPWGLPDGATFVLPLIAATPIFQFTARGGDVLPRPRTTVTNAAVHIAIDEDRRCADIANNVSSCSKRESRSYNCVTWSDSYSQ